ncbi:MAG: stealth conserved region 3 domain-containing protein [Sporichthyaceae bacterium]
MAKDPARIAKGVLGDLAAARRLGPRRAAAQLKARVGGQTGAEGALASAVRGSVFAVEFPIDVVYTWVDGSDADWQSRRTAAWAKARPDELSPIAANPSRWINRDELRYSLRSLATHAPWVRNVYVVTDRQTPSWLDTGYSRVRVVDHSEIFPSRDCLPTFNSHSIESRLHHIDGLSEHYLYLNDDMFLGRTVHPEDFFVGNGLARLFPSPKPLPEGPANTTDTPVEAAGKNNRDLLAAKFGRAPTHRFLHAPYPQLRSVLNELENAFATEFARTAASRFRHPSDVSIPASLLGTYAYLTGRAVPATIPYVYVDLADPRLPRRLAALRRTRPSAFCLNDHAGLGADPAAVNEAVRATLEALFPVPSPFERA